MKIHFFTALFYFASIWFRVQGSRGGFAAFFRRWYSRIVKANTGYVEKKNNDGQSLPREGKVASEASRIGY